MKRFLSLLGLVLFMTSAFAENPSTHTYKVVKDIEWARLDGFGLTMDIYTPDAGKTSYPVIVIYHGGGWLINTKSIMDQMSQYLASHGEYVVCNVNYRLLGDNSNTVTMDQIIDDGLGALLWVKNHIKKYQGDPEKICVTGDSAGGQIASMILNCGDKLTSKDFASSLQFKPTWLPDGATPEELAKRHALEVQAAIISYGASNINDTCKRGFETASNSFWERAKVKPRGIFGDGISLANHPEYYKAVSPLFTFPQATERKLPPMLLTVGSKDDAVTPESVQRYVTALKEAGQPAEYWEYVGHPHAFLDSGTNEGLGITFEKDAIPPLDHMLGFLNQIFY